MCGRFLVGGRHYPKNQSDATGAKRWRLWGSKTFFENPKHYFPHRLDVLPQAWELCRNAKRKPQRKHGETTMNDTATNPTVAAIQEQLKRLEWMIPDAKKRVAKAAEQMLWRAQRAVEDATAMLNDQPCSLSWPDFADGDLREAKEAKAELNKLYEQQKLLQYLIKNQ
jgi:hypothetical protein